MATINPNSGGFFTDGPSGVPPGPSTQDLYVTSGVVTGENLVLTLSNQSTVTISLTSVFANGTLTGVNYNQANGLLTINQGSRSLSTTIDTSGDALTTASISYDAPTSTLVIVETDGTTETEFRVPFPTIIEDIYDADGNQLVVTTVDGRTRVTLPDYVTQDSLDEDLAGKEDKIDAILVDIISPTTAQLGLYSEDAQGNATRTDNDQPLQIKTTGGITLSSEDPHQTGGLSYDLIVEGGGNETIGGLLALETTDHKAIQLALYDTDAERIGQAIQIATVDSVTQQQDINIDVAEPTDPVPDGTVTQHIILTMNKADEIVEGGALVPTQDAVYNAIQAIEPGGLSTVATDTTIHGDGSADDPLGVSANNVIGGLLSITSTPDKVAEIGLYDPSSNRIGQQFVISTVDSINNIQDININSEPSSGTSTNTLAQRMEITLNKATAIIDGELRVPTTQAIFDYIQEIETDPVTAAAVRAVLQNDTGSGGIQWSIDSGTGDIVGIANSDTSKQDLITNEATTPATIKTQIADSVVTVAVTGSGENIVGVEETDGVLTAVTRGTITGGGASATISSTAPSNPGEGDVWINCDTGIEYVWWTSTGPWVQTGGVGYESAAISGGGSDIDLSGIAVGALVKVNATQDGFVLAVDGVDYNVGSSVSEFLTKVTAIATVSNDGTLAYPPSAFSSGGVALTGISPAHILTYNGLTLNGTIDYNFVGNSIVLTANAEAALTDGEQLVLIDFSSTQSEPLDKTTATATVFSDGTLTYTPSAFSSGGVALTEILTTHILTYNGLTLNETIDYNLMDGDIVLTTGAEAALTDGQQLVLITITQPTGE